MTVGLSVFFKRCRKRRLRAQPSVQSRGGGHTVLFPLFFLNWRKIGNNYISTRLQPGFIKGGHIICHILQYNRPIIGGDRLVFFHYWDRSPPKYMVVTPMLTTVPKPRSSPIPAQLSSTLVESPEPAQVHTIPSDYAAFQDVFSKQAATRLPPHRPWDCAIDLLPGTKLPKGRV